MKIGAIAGACVLGSMLGCALAACSSQPIEPARRAPDSQAAAAAKASSAPSGRPAASTSASAEAASGPKKPAWETQIEQFRAISVVVRQPELKSEDSVHLNKVAQAIEGANPGMFVHYVARGAETRIIYDEDFYDNGHACLRAPEEGKYRPTSPLIGKYGGSVEVCYASDEPMYLGVKGQGPPLPDKMPGLVWEVNEHSVDFVALDGGEYVIDLAQKEEPRPTLELGAGPPSTWPAPGGDSGFGRSAMNNPKFTVSGDLEKVDAAFGACADKTWKREHKKVEDKNFKADPEMKAWVVDEEFTEDVVMGLALRRGCKAQIDIWEKAFVGLIEQRVKARSDLYEKAKARVTVIGADK